MSVKNFFVQKGKRLQSIIGKVALFSLIKGYCGCYSKKSLKNSQVGGNNNQLGSTYIYSFMNVGSGKTLPFSFPVKKNNVTTLYFPVCCM